jgi:hypothetical protein
MRERKIKNGPGTFFIFLSRIFLLVVTQIFRDERFLLCALKGRRKLAGGGTAGMPVVIDLRPGRGAGSEHREKTHRSSKFRPAPLPGRDRLALSYRRFHRRLISTAPPARKKKIWVTTSIFPFGLTRFVARSTGELVTGVIGTL